MKKIRKILALTISILICLSLFAACNKDDNTNNSSPNTSGTADASNTGGGDASGGNTDSGNTGGGNTGGGNNTTGNTNDSEESSTGRPVPNNSRYGNSSYPVEKYPLDPMPTGTRVSDEILIVGENFAPINMNPFLPGGFAPVQWGYRLMYDTLILPTDTIGEYATNLATEWTTDDYKTFTFKLRNDVFFHNGDKLTASDVVFTVNLAKESSGAPAFDVWYFVDTATALDENTVQLVLDKVNVDFLYYIQGPSAGIVSEKAVTENFEKGAQIGTGPYYLSEFVSGDYWVCERNDNYWGTPTYTKKFTLKYIPEIATRAIMLSNGECQIVMRLNGDDMQLFENNPNYTLYDRIINNPMTINFNQADPLCSDWNFKMAVVSALDREACAIAYGGNYAVPDYSGDCYGRYTEFRNPNIAPIPEDIDAAKAYLEESSYNGETVEIMAYLAGNIRAAEAIQQQLDRIGIKTELKVMESAAVQAYRLWDNNQTQIVIDACMFTMTATSMRGSLYPEHVANNVRYNNQEVADLFDQAGAEPDYEKRKEIYMEIQRIVAEDPPRFNLFWVQDPCAAVAGLEGVAWRTDGFHDFRYAYWDLDA